MGLTQQHNRRDGAVLPSPGRLTFLTTLVALIVACLWTASAYGGSPWHSAVRISKPKQGAMLDPEIVIDDAGEAVAVWQRAGNKRFPVIQSASRPAGGSWSAPVDISQMGERLKALSPEIAVSAAGEVDVVWEQIRQGHAGGVIESAARRPGGAWSKPVTISTTSGLAQDPEIVMNDAGEAVAVWEVFVDVGNRVIQSATRTPGGAWSAPTSLTARGEESEGPGIVMSDAGEAIISWDTVFGRHLSRDIIETASRPPGGPWSVPIELAETRAFEIFDQEIAISPTGEAIAIWERVTERPGRESALIQSASRPVGGTWSAPTDITARGSPTLDIPVIAIGPGGEAVAVWTRSVGQAHSSSPHVLIQSASHAPGGVWSAPVGIFSAHVFELPSPTIAIDAAGDAVTVWQNEQAAIQGASRSPVGVWSATTTLFRERANQTLFPEIAISPAGEAVTVWQTPTGIQSTSATFGG